MGPLMPIIGLRLLAFAAGLRHNAEIGQPGLCFSAYGHKFGINHLEAYLLARAEARIILVGEAAGYRGARVSGLPFTSERQLTGIGPAEATATIVHRVLAKLGVSDDVLLWNAVPTHPGTETSNRRPTRAEIQAASPFLHE